MWVASACPTYHILLKRKVPEPHSSEYRNLLSTFHTKWILNICLKPVTLMNTHYEKLPLWWLNQAVMPSTSIQNKDILSPTINLWNISRQLSSLSSAFPYLVFTALIILTIQWRIPFCVGFAFSYTQVSQHQSAFQRVKVNSVPHPKITDSYLSWTGYYAYVNKS